LLCRLAIDAKQLHAMISEATIASLAFESWFWIFINWCGNCLQNHCIGFNSPQNTPEKDSNRFHCAQFVCDCWFLTIIVCVDDRNDYREIGLSKDSDQPIVSDDLSKTPRASIQNSPDDSKRCSDIEPTIDICLPHLLRRCGNCRIIRKRRLVYSPTRWFHVYLAMF
jgi:hypothetical protein